MKKVRRWLSELIFNQLNENKEASSNRSVFGEFAGPRESLESTRYSLIIYPAQGGTAIECRHYNEAKDQHNNTLYIITDQDNLSDELSKIITMNALQA